MQGREEFASAILGFDQAFEWLAAGGSVGRPHVARALVGGGYCASVAEAFDKCLGTGKPGYVPKARFQISEAVALIRACGGVTSVAHPTLYTNHQRIVTDVFDAGIDAASSEALQNIARFRTASSPAAPTTTERSRPTETLGTIRVPERRHRPILERL